MDGRSDVRLSSIGFTGFFKIVLVAFISCKIYDTILFSGPQALAKSYQFILC